MLTLPVQPSDVAAVHVSFWNASPLCLFEAGLPMLAQKAPVLSQLLLAVLPASGSSPNRLQGLPSGTGPAYSAMAWRDTLVDGTPMRPPKMFFTVVLTSTRRRVDPPASDGATMVPVPLVNPLPVAYWRAMS